MPEYKAPGVYVEEVERGPKTIEGVSTSVAGFLGQTERGPEKPRLVTSFADYRRIYGGVIEESNLAYAVKGFFDNGGSQAYIGRITRFVNSATASIDGMRVPAGFGSTPDADLVSKSVLRGPQVVDFGSIAASSSTTQTVTIKNVGPHGDIDVDKDEITIEEPAGQNVFSVSDSWPDGENPKTLSPTDEVDIDITFTAPDADPKKGSLKVPHTGESSSDPVTVSLYGNWEILDAAAVGPGGWGDGVALIVEDATLYKERSNDLFKLTVRYWSDETARARVANSGTEYEDIPDVPEPDVEEVYDNLSPDPASNNYYVSEVSGASNLVDLEQEGEGRPANGVTWLSYSAATGSNAPPDEVNVTHYKGTATEPEDRTGLAAFDEVDEITILCAPDENKHGKQLRNALVTHCSDRKDRMVILQAGENETNPGDLSPPVDSSYAAFYHPWITVTDPDTGNEATVPPGGHVAGIYARNDAEHGVHKAPANETVRGALSLKVNVSKGDQATLNPKGVNCIRSFPGRGIRLWGARTTSSDPSWKYVNVRRLFMFVEESVDEGTQWVVFENNTEELWARVRQTVSDFLTTLWEDGALMGSTPEEAFYVKCDRSTMTQNDIDNGRLICEIGIAPVKPAEFVVFRISQWTEGVEGGG